MQHRDTATPFLFLTTSAAAVLQLPKVESLGAGTGELPTKESNMQLSEAYCRWFRDEGQFLQPADALGGEQLEILKLWGVHAHESHIKEIDALHNEYEQQLEDPDKPKPTVPLWRCDCGRYVYMDISECPYCAFKDCTHLTTLNYDYETGQPMRIQL